MMSVDEAFLEGLRLVREAGLKARGTDAQVLAAHATFTRKAEPLQHDDRFDAQAPLYAKKLILLAYALDDPRGPADLSSVVA